MSHEFEDHRMKQNTKHGVDHVSTMPGIGPISNWIAFFGSHKTLKVELRPEEND